MNPSIKVRNESGKTIKKLSIEKQGFINLSLPDLQFTNNFLNFKNLPNIAEFSINSKKLYIQLKSKTKNLSQSQILQKNKLPRLNLHKNPHFLNIKDIIYTKKSLFITKLTNIQNIFNIDIINSSLKDENLSYLNDSWIFGDSSKPIFERCNYCKELDNNLIKVCGCMTVHKHCFMEIFSGLTRTIKGGNFLRVEVEDFFCQSCGRDFEPFYKVDGTYQCFLNLGEARFLNCFFLIKKNERILKMRKFVGILFFNLSDKKYFYYKKHFKMKIKNSQLVIKGILRNNCYVYSPHQYVIKQKYIKKSFFLINKKQFHFRFKKKNFFSNLKNSLCSSKLKENNKEEEKKLKFSNIVTFGTLDEYVSNKI